ncbi:hypothetical protein YSA_06200 [Pseudomonas putida ND6]|uniref:Uncharacterized protein n=1 Tax=Pseudomonas putida ND6 TaxID=231023 RepID=I3UXA2_PSEPU|nr:hypothetical protein YSA_06200 [Pseudomonas putida ND6]
MAGWRASATLERLPFLEVCSDENYRKCVEPKPRLPLASPARSACGQFPQRG